VTGRYKGQGQVAQSVSGAGLRYRLRYRPCSWGAPRRPACTLHASVPEALRPAPPACVIRRFQVCFTALLLPPPLPPGKPLLVHAGNRHSHPPPACFLLVPLCRASPTPSGWMGSYLCLPATPPLCVGRSWASLLMSTPTSGGSPVRALPRACSLQLCGCSWPEQLPVTPAALPQGPASAACRWCSARAGAPRGHLQPGLDAHLTTSSVRARCPRLASHGPPHLGAGT
jgi:hypothetical protein